MEAAARLIIFGALVHAVAVTASPPLENFVHPDFVRGSSSSTGSGSTDARRRSNSFQKRGAAEDVQFYPPASNGGSQLTFVSNTYPADLGEPINIIISATSDSRVLKNQMDNGGLLNYFQSVGFNGECLGQHMGGSQQADLGDGHGKLNETAVMRWNYGDPQLGTCKETFDGGNHFRYWMQNGPKQNTGAVFLAVSYEKPVDAGHDIVFNGYNLARDEFIGNATAMQYAPPTGSYALVPPPSVNTTSSNTTNTTTSSTSPSSTLTSASFTYSLLTSPTATSLPAALQTLSSSITSSSSESSTRITIAHTLPSFIGQSSSNNFTYRTTAVYVTGLLGNTSDGVNHFSTVGNASTGMNAIDGLVALLQVDIVRAPDGSGALILTTPGRLSLTLLVISVAWLQLCLL